MQLPHVLVPQKPKDQNITVNAVGQLPTSELVRITIESLYITHYVTDVISLNCNAMEHFL